MILQGRFLFLGSGSSMGVPVIGCKCAVCRSGHPNNKRLRCAGLVEIDQKRLLIDAGPDIRTQLLRADIDRLDGLLITHAHYDHTGGLDDLRILSLAPTAPLPCLMSHATYSDIAQRCGYLFPSQQQKIANARFSLQFLEKPTGTVSFLGLPISYCTYAQTHMEVNGYRFGDFAYLTDILNYPPNIFQELVGVRTLVISALRMQPQHLHFTVEQAIAFAQKVGVETCYLTHLAHELDYEETQTQLPTGVFLAYDGLSFSFTLEVNNAYA